jgi:hypothetical protein
VRLLKLQAEIFIRNRFPPANFCYTIVNHLPIVVQPDEYERVAETIIVITQVIITAAVA